ncbi:hypothetical protein [Acetobacter fallax]|uniref:Uncharacterized protein n=1 Tax=Acetobacter fallax TaxID=1737473 RepID=A0ABX0KC09_9PROT|nr:hypothetical protein [Acetobacter fallax]NHO33323.1 hypothetical protein [Acetobacter fallax]NHO36944.1 hypothetical protein [Acetobacter fallax]
MPLTSDSSYLEKRVPHGPEFPHVVAAGVKTFRGSICLVCQDGTIVLPQTENPPSPVVAVVGLADRQLDATATAGLAPAVGGEPPLWPKKGCWALPFDTAPTWADYGKPAYAVDDAQVSLTETPSGGSARLPVGTIAGFDEAGNAFVLIA